MIRPVIFLVLVISTDTMKSEYERSCPEIISMMKKRNILLFACNPLETRCGIGQVSTRKVQLEYSMSARNSKWCSNRLFACKETIRSSRYAVCSLTSSTSIPSSDISIASADRILSEFDREQQIVAKTLREGLGGGTSAARLETYLRVKSILSSKYAMSNCKVL
jgi:hypothetical protein